jgi:PleD family two-component response regulator
MAFAKSDSRIAGVLAAIENRLMTKVLLIEDDSETAEEITAELTERGFEVEWSANGIEGLDKAHALRPDAMIVDRLCREWTASPSSRPCATTICAPRSWC